jgi:glycosidase
MHALYRGLLGLRRAHPALALGRMEMSPLDGDLLRFERRHDGERIVVLINMGREPVALPSDLVLARLLFSTSPSPSRAGTVRLLDADEAAIYLLDA